MKKAVITTRLFGENVYIVWDEATGVAAVIDPGMMEDSERTEVENVIVQEKLNVKYVLLTHCHIDHVCSARWIADINGAKVCASKEDTMLANSLAIQAKMFYLRISPQPLTVDINLNQDDEIVLGDTTIKVMATPGHTKGGLTFYSPKEHIAFVGDTIFQRSIGRTDLPGGNEKTLLKSIKSQLFKLPTDTILAPGHGPATTVGEELIGNPYF